MSEIDPTTAEVVRLKQEGATWRQIDEAFPDVKRETLRGKWRRWKRGKKPDSPNREQFTQHVNKNTATYESKSPRIKTLEQLLEAAEVDLSIWKVDHWLVNKWEVGAREQWTDITWKDGRIEEGHKREEGLHVEPLWQVKAWLVRIKPESIFPAIRPVKCKATYRKPRPPSGGLRRAMLWADPQFGFHRSTRTATLQSFHCRATIDVILQITIAAQVNEVHILGDLLDLPEWSDKFLKHPQFYWSTQPSLEEAHWTLAQFRQALPDARITAHEGNHDKRMPEAILRHLPAAYDLRQAGRGIEPQWGTLSVPYLLDLEGLRIEWVAGYPDDVQRLNDGAILRHGNVARAKSNESARSIAQNATVTEFFGHTHKLEMASRTRWPGTGPEVIQAVSIGCACKIDGTVPGSKTGDQWQNGCCVVDYEADGAMASGNPVLIKDGRAVWDGCLFNARDRLEDLRGDLPDWKWV